MKSRGASGRERVSARPFGLRAGPWRARLGLSWGLAYLLLAQLIFTGFAAGTAMAAQGHDSPAYCSGIIDASGPQDQAPHGAPHCLLCPQAGHIPLVPAPFALSAPPAAFGPAADRVSRPAEPRLWAIREGARTRAPPLPILPSA